MRNSRSQALATTYRNLINFIARLLPQFFFFSSDDIPDLNCGHSLLFSRCVALTVSANSVILSSDLFNISIQFRRRRIYLPMLIAHSSALLFDIPITGKLTKDGGTLSLALPLLPTSNVRAPGCISLLCFSLK